MKKIIFLAAAVVALAGCEKFLEPRSQTEYTPSNVQQLEELILAALPDPTETGGAFTGGFLDVMTDDVKTRRTIPVMNQVNDKWYSQAYVTAVRALYTWQSNYSVTEEWSFPFTRWGAVYNATYEKLVYINSVLDYLDEVSGLESTKNYVRAQAYALRAFYYLNLVNIYGEPYQKGANGQGVPLRLTGAKENRKMVRNTVGEVYARIEEDLLNSVELFSKLEAHRQNREYHPTMPMALLLLARTYLFMENWEQAEVYARKLIDDWGGEFSVMDLKSEVLDFYSNDNPVVSALPQQSQTFYPHFKTYTNPEAIWIYGSAADAVALTGNDMYQGGAAMQNYVYSSLTLASDALVGSYAAGDIRLKTYFVRNLYDNPGAPDYNAYRAYGKMNISVTEGGLDGVADGDNRYNPATESIVFGYALRMSEGWLILAEALAEQGDDAEALAAMAEVQKKRFAGGTIPAAYTSGKPVVDLVREERRREFCFEAMRWFDLRRWGMPQIEHVWYDTTIGSTAGPMKYVLNEGDAGYTLPMPKEVMDRNTDLTQVPLNSNRNPQ